MSPMRRGFPLPTWAILILTLPLLLGFGSCRPGDPIIFVHGGSGSGAQFQSQSMRFQSNGYPKEYIAVVEYDSFGLAFPEDLEVVHAEIDARIADLQAELDVDQVVLIGHSRGTTVSHDYLSFPDRAANVSKYVNIDGRTADAPPGGVPTLALWGGAVFREEPPEIVGAKNVTIPDQEHVQVATSEEAFFEIYRFLHHRKPITTKILPRIFSEVSGRVVQFPANTGLDGATLEIWRLDSDTAERVGWGPWATFEIAADGEFGPFWAVIGRHYEFAVIRDGFETIHTFVEPFLHDDHLVRINVADALTSLLPSSPDSTGVSIVRYKEFWGDRGAENDILSIDGTDVITAGVFPSGAVGAANVAYFGLDLNLDGMTGDLSVPVFPFTLLPFIAGSDLFIPTDSPGPVTIEIVPRGDLGKARTINVRRIPSDEGGVAIQLRDFEQ